MYVEIISSLLSIDLKNFKLLFFDERVLLIFCLKKSFCFIQAGARMFVNKVNRVQKYWVFRFEKEKVSQKSYFRHKKKEIKK